MTQIRRVFQLVHPFWTEPSPSQVEKWKQIIDFVAENKDSALVIERASLEHAPGQSKTVRELLAHIEEATKKAADRIIINYDELGKPLAIKREQLSQRAEILSFGKRALGCLPANSLLLAYKLGVQSNRIHIYPRAPYSDDKGEYSGKQRVVFPPQDPKSEEHARSTLRYRKVLRDNSSSPIYKECGLRLSLHKVPSIEAMLRKWRASRRA